MEKQEAMDIVCTGLVGENSIPVKLRVTRELDLDLLDQVREALDVLTNCYKGEETVPKKLAITMVDIYGAFSFQEGYFETAFLKELEDIGMELQEKAIELFSD